MKPRKFVSAFFLSMLVLILNSCSPKLISTTTTAPNQDSPILIKARIWVQAKVPYGSFGFHNNPPFYDGYKADCSGYVSYAWGLNAPGIGTNQFVSENYAIVISISDLQPGDVLNNDQADTAGHMVIFVKWLDRAKNIFDAYDLNTDPGYTSEKAYTLVQIPNSDNWTISELDPWAPGPYRAERLTNPNGIAVTQESTPSISLENQIVGTWHNQSSSWPSCPNGESCITFQFFQDGTAFLDFGPFGTASGNYSFLDDHTVQVNTPLNGEMVITIFNIKMVNDVMVLTTLDNHQRVKLVEWPNGLPFDRGN
jgi:hypothetical protein